MPPRKEPTRAIGRIRKPVGTPAIHGHPQKASRSSRTARSSGWRSSRETVKGKERGRRTPKGRKGEVRVRGLPTPRRRTPERAQKGGGRRSAR